MKILVTGAKGFIGRNLISELKNRKYTDILEFDVNTGLSLLDEYCKEANFVFHLAGVNRPRDVTEFMVENFVFTSTLLEKLKGHKNECPLMFSSSTQAVLSNPYGESKKAGASLMWDYSEETGARVLIYRFPNAFGKWCKPNYNSVVATFCYNIARGLPITVNDPSVVMNFIYIDDLVNEMVNALEGRENKVGIFCEVEPVQEITLGKVVEYIYSFKESREDRLIPDMSSEFVKKLYSTYLSYLPKDEFSYKLEMNVDERGSFTEFIKTADRGQVSVNISKAGVVKGNHWHHTKNEKFLVVSGEGVIRLRRIGKEEVLEYFVSDRDLEVVDIPVGYTHNIENLGNSDMVTVMWVNEVFDPERADTYFLEVGS